MERPEYVKKNYLVQIMRHYSATLDVPDANLLQNVQVGMSADCSQDVDYYPENATLFTANSDAYVHNMEVGGPGIKTTNVDWVYMVELWSLSINLNGGTTEDNASNARILTELALTEPQLSGSLPSMAEALAAMVSNTLVAGSIDTPFVHYWDHGAATVLLPGGGGPAAVRFPARVRSQEYASWHTEAWQGVFYAVLAPALLLNLVFLAYLCRVGLVRDFLEPTSLFALATARAGAPARTPEVERLERKGRAHLVVPWRLSYRPDADHFYFEEASGGAAGGGGAGVNRATSISSAVELEDDVGRKRSYVRFSGKPLS